MLNWIIDFSLRNRAVVLIAMLGVIVAGGWSLQYLDIDALSRYDAGDGANQHYGARRSPRRKSSVKSLFRLNKS